MSEADEVTIPTAELRRILHHYNNLTARVLTRAEVALLEPDPAEHVAALEAICESAIAIGAFTRETRARLLGRDD